jgi:acetolactate synthase-1/3 small subunit
MPDDLTPQQIRRKKAFGEPVYEDEEPSGDEQRHLIAVLVKNTTGAFNRVANLFSARGFNLESVAVGETEEEGVARMTLATTGNDRIIAQVMRQLRGLVDTLEVDDLTDEEYVERELCLLKVRYSSDNRAEIMGNLEIFRGKVVDVKPGTMTFELTGPTKKINAFIGMMRSYEIVEIARSGRVAMRRALFYGD